MNLTLVKKSMLEDIIILMASLTRKNPHLGQSPEQEETINHPLKNCQIVSTIRGWGANIFKSWDRNIDSIQGTHET